MIFESEQKTYARALPNLLTEQGKFALVVGDEVVGAYGTYEDALTVGYERFGLKPFMIRQIEAVQHVQQFTRRITPCHT